MFNHQSFSKVSGLLKQDHRDWKLHSFAYVASVTRYQQIAAVKLIYYSNRIFSAEYLLTLVPNCKTLYLEPWVSVDPKIWFDILKRFLTWSILKAHFRIGLSITHNIC